MSKVEIPDFEDMLKLVNEISDLSLKRNLLDAKLQYCEAEIIKQMRIDKTFFEGGKPPSMDYIKKTYMYTGLQGELVEPREEYATLSAKLEHTRLKFDLCKMQIDLYRTEQANNRHTQL